MYDVFWKGILQRKTIEDEKSRKLKEGGQKMEKGEISEEFKTGRFYGLMRENPENVWDKFMQEEKKIQVQGVQKKVSPD